MPSAWLKTNCVFVVVCWYTSGGVLMMEWLKAWKSKGGWWWRLGAVFGPSRSPTFFSIDRTLVDPYTYTRHETHGHVYSRPRQERRSRIATNKCQATKEQCRQTKRIRIQLQSKKEGDARVPEAAANLLRYATVVTILLIFSFYWHWLSRSGRYYQGYPKQLVCHCYGRNRKWKNDAWVRVQQLDCNVSMRLNPRFLLRDTTIYLWSRSRIKRFGRSSDYTA